MECGVCGSAFAPKMKSQKYCSRTCYKRSWAMNHRAQHNARSRSRRAENAEWYRAREPRYYRNYRASQEEKRPWRYVFQSRRLDARKRGIVFTLTDEWCAARWTGRCEVTGLNFVKNPRGRGPHPLSATLDRIRPEDGYIPENCRFVLHAVNCMKGSDTDEQMFLIAGAISESPVRIHNTPGSSVV